MKYFLFTFGCQMNVYDSEKVEKFLEKNGWQSVSIEDQADLILANICSVRQTAIDRVYGKIKNWQKLKEKNPCLKIGLFGCLLENDKKKLEKKVDFIFQINKMSILKKNLSQIVSSNFRANKESNGCHPGPDIHQGKDLNSRFFSRHMSGEYFPQNDNEILSRQLAKLRCPSKSLRITNEILSPMDIRVKMTKKNTQIEPKYVAIMTGCNNFCSYCVVPYTRGREISKPVKDVIKEIQNLIKKGYKEICLLGQNVNSYKSQIANRIRQLADKFQTNPIPQNMRDKTQNPKLEIIDFPKLLKIIEKIPGNFEISFLTSHPKDFSDKLIEVIASSDKIKKEIHLPIQSGDNQILKKMNRGYTKENYLNLIKKIRKKIPQIKISTDIIVGFPSETENQFLNTLKLCQEVKFDKAYINKYSPRPVTKAFKLKDDISWEEKKRRWKILNKIINNP